MGEGRERDIQKGGQHQQVQGIGETRKGLLVLLESLTRHFHLNKLTLLSNLFFKMHISVCRLISQGQL